MTVDLEYSESTSREVENGVHLKSTGPGCDFIV